MFKDKSDQLGEMISLLKQLLDQQQKENGLREQVARSISSHRPDFVADRKDHELRMVEIKREAEQRRKEDNAFREELLSLLRQFSDALPRLMKRLDDLEQKL